MVTVIVFLAALVSSGEVSQSDNPNIDESSGCKDKFVELSTQMHESVLIVDNEAKEVKFCSQNLVVLGEESTILERLRLTPVCVEIGKLLKRNEASSDLPKTVERDRV